MGAQMSEPPSDLLPYAAGAARDHRNLAVKMRRAQFQSGKQLFHFVLRRESLGSHRIQFKRREAAGKTLRTDSIAIVPLT